LTLVGGSTGDAIRRDFSQLGIEARWIEASTPTRVCTTLLDCSRRQATELVPNAAQAAAAELDSFRSAFEEEAVHATVIVLIGSLPTGTPVEYYRELLRRRYYRERIRCYPSRIVLDARGPELLEVLQYRPFLVKPNRGELQLTLGRELRTDADLFAALREINERGAEWVVVTDGSKPVYARSRNALYRLQAPPSEVVNPIGCGDCMAAGIAQALADGREPLDALRWGVAVAANKVRQILPGFVDRAEVEALVPQVQVTPVRE
jgi:1-phosphofructokinase family hexose kinase